MLIFDSSKRTKMPQIYFEWIHLSLFKHKSVRTTQKQDSKAELQQQFLTYWSSLNQNLL
jgi:hypothetical protein